jgi:hypothetical protein
MTKMSQKLEIIVRIKNENEEVIIEKTSKKEIPDLPEFDRQGFRASFDQIERAFISGRKEATDEAVSDYLGLISKKKS